MCKEAIHNESDDACAVILYPLDSTLGCIPQWGAHNFQASFQSKTADMTLTTFRIRHFHALQPLRPSITPKYSLSKCEHRVFDKCYRRIFSVDVSRLFNGFFNCPGRFKSKVLYQRRTLSTRNKDLGYILESFQRIGGHMIPCMG